MIYSKTGADLHVAPAINDLYYFPAAEPVLRPAVLAALLLLLPDHHPVSDRHPVSRCHPVPHRR